MAPQGPPAWSLVDQDLFARARTSGGPGGGKASGRGGLVAASRSDATGCFGMRLAQTMETRSENSSLWFNCSLLAATGEANGLFTVVGVYTDDTCSAPLAKYSDLRRAVDAANLVNRIARVRGPVESN
jgi:hypothetical protein